ncbi:MAG: metallophosphoesterase, partial [Pseudomonadota bacterium]
MRIAVLTDTHIRAPEGDTSSPYAVNELANARAHYASALLASLKPDHTVHLGDMVHPLPHMHAYASAAAEAHRLFEPLMPALHFVPGNHDIGDKPSPGLPAKATNGEHIDRFESAFGESAWAHVCGHFTLVAINSSLINTGLEQEQAQFDWLQQTLSDHREQRILLFSHYPPFILAPDEPDHYDNIAEPGRSRLLRMASDAGVAAIFSGHVHQFFFNRHADMQLWCLPATSFTRQDYSELFRGEPAPEFGRDDTDKYGVVLIETEDDRFNVDWLPTFGRQLQAHDEATTFDSQAPNWRGLIPHLRHDWHSPVSLPYNGPMEEFSRKAARNDYPLLRLLQCGIDCVRVPLADLVNDNSRQRMLDWASLGVRFVLFKLGTPSQAEIALVNQHASLLRGVELVTSQS